jgi:hypothetical protein
MTSWCLLLALVLTLHSNSTYADFVDRNILTLISAFLDENRVNFVVFINCGAVGNDIELEFVLYHKLQNVVYVHVLRKNIRFDM